MKRPVYQCTLVLPELVPFEMAEQGANQLANAALACWHHALQAHDQVPVVLGVEDDQLVLPRGHTHTRHLREQEQGERKGENGAQSNEVYCCFP